MKKGILLSALLVVILSSILGCNKYDIDDQPKDIESDYSQLDEVSKDNSINLVLDREIQKVSISKLNDSDATILDFSGTLKDKEALEIFKNILLDASEEEGIVNMTNPNFSLEITYEDDNKQEFNFWTAKEGRKSSLMKTNDTHTLYSISEEDTHKLTDLIK